MENERPLFKFYRSYWNVANELCDKDRLSFYDALIKKQFTGEETNLKGMANFAYISQKHNIDAQVKGFTDKTGVILNPIAPPIAPPTIQLELETQIEVKEEIKHSFFDFDSFWKMYAKSVDKEKCKKVYAKISEPERAEIKIKLPLYIDTIKDKQFQKHPLKYLNGKCWNDIEEVPAVTYDFSKPSANNGVIKF
jgi:hypothetical protein